MASLAEELAAVPSLESLGIDKLSNAQRLRLMGLIWDSLDEEWQPRGVTEVPEHFREELARRAAEADANPDAGLPREKWTGRLAKFAAG